MMGVLGRALFLFLLLFLDLMQHLRPIGWLRNPLVHFRRQIEQEPRME